MIFFMLLNIITFPSTMHGSTLKMIFLILGVGIREPSMMKMYHSRFISFLNLQFNAEIESYIKEEIGMMPYIRPGCPVDLRKGRKAVNFFNPIEKGISSALIRAIKQQK